MNGHLTSPGRLALIAFAATLVAASVGDAQRGTTALLPPPRALPHPSNVLDLAFAPDGRLLATVSSSQPVRLWDPASGQLVRTLSEVSAAGAIAFSPDGKWLAASDAAGAVRAWNTQTWTLASAALLTAGRPYPGLSFGRLPARKAGSGTLQLQRTVLAAWTGGEARIYEVLPNATTVPLYVLQCSSTPPDPNDPYTPRVHSVRFARSGSTAVMVCDHRVTMVDAATGTQQLVVPAPLVEDAVLSGDGRFLAHVRQAVADAPQVQVRVLSQSLEVTFAPPPPSPGYYSAAFSPDAAVLATGQWQSGAVVLWTVATRKLLRTLTGHSSVVTRLAFSPDGSILASGGSVDKTVRLWKMR